MKFIYGIFTFICFGLIESFVLHPPSRAYNDDGDDAGRSSKDDALPVGPLNQLRSSDLDPNSHASPSGFTAACNASLCDSGSNALNNSCCENHGTLLESWLGVLGLMASVALYAIIAYCYIWRRNRSHRQQQQQQQQQQRNNSRPSTSSEFPNDNTNIQLTPPPEYTGVLAVHDSLVEEAAPPTYEEAMRMVPEQVARQMSNEQTNKTIRVEERRKRLPFRQNSKRFSFDAITRRFTS